MAFSPNVWNQLKNITKKEFVSALQRDGWARDPASKDATLTYLKRIGIQNRRIVIHYHADHVCGPKLLKALLKDCGWTTDDDLRRVGLIN